ncbi:MAG: hypothetical protein IJ493_08755 [Clostridia bacterium]|nr:hypothetical protein [Clostridia bacterium]
MEKRKVSLHKNESGLAIVEATILLPVCIIMVVAIYYASIFMCQKANLQANVQNTLIYYKNVDSDTYVTLNTNNMTYTSGSGTVDADGSSYGTPTPLFPYRFFSFNVQQSKFEQFFRSMCGYMFFDTGTNVELKVVPKNYVVYKTITATATQTVKPAVSLSLIGLSDEITIKVTGKVVVTDGDDFIRNVDLVIDLVEDTKFGEIVKSIGTKAGELYQSFKTNFNID